jgi:hypothetical protein
MATRPEGSDHMGLVTPKAAGRDEGAHTLAPNGRRRRSRRGHLTVLAFASS